MLDSAIPGALAAAYAWWSHHGVSPSPWPLIVKDFSISYFFLMWFVGQYSRVAKRLEDKLLLQYLTTEVAAVREAILKTGGSPDRQTSSQQMLAIADPVARELVIESRAALDAGLNKSGILTLAAAFEHSLRTFARNQGIPRAAFLPVSQLLELLSPHLGASVVADLRNLWLTRHTLIHLSEKETIPVDQASSIANAFLWAMQLLNAQGR